MTTQRTSSNPSRARMKTPHRRMILRAGGVIFIVLGSVFGFVGHRYDIGAYDLTLALLMLYIGDRS